MAETTPVFKVFVGNLSFKTTKQDLAATFTQAGKVVDANIITRGQRSLGYGFVDFETQEAADKAISTLHKFSLDGREINVEHAKPADPSRAPRTSSYRGRGTGVPRGRGRGRGYGGHRGRGRGSRGRGGRPPTSHPRSRTPSTTTLFATNLPFSLEDQELRDLFTEYKVKSAYVVRRENHRSKGFGFIEFESEQDQQAALAKFNKQQVKGRELILRIAYLDTNPQSGAHPAAASDSAAPAAAPPSTA